MNFPRFKDIDDTLEVGDDRQRTEELYRAYREVMVNGFDEVYVERKGRRHHAGRDRRRTLRRAEPPEGLAGRRDSYLG